MAIDPTLVRMAEHVLSRICFAYKAHGGFNVIAAGGSNEKDGTIQAGKYQALQTAAANSCFMEAYHE